MFHRTCITLLATAVLAGVAAPAHAAAPPMRDVIAVGNNWDGTASIVDAHSFRTIMHFSVVPDLAQRRLEMISSPYYLLIHQLVGEGHDQLVDDMFTSTDGRRVYVSRPSLADVVAIDLATKQIVWRAHVDGARADHMAISHDGTRLLVSASTANVVDVIDTATGKILTSFPSGDSPHESNFSADGNVVYHASIGRVYVPTTDKVSDMAKGTKLFEIVDAHTWKVLGSFDLNDKLAAFGRPDVDGTIRPMALSPDERYAYFQTSFHHGFVEYDLKAGKVTRVLDLPARTEDYVLNSAHHGLAMNHEGTKLCAAGTIDDYVAIVHRDTFSYTLLNTGDRPYWATDSLDGRLCFVSIAGDDYVSVISYDQEREIAKIPVGDHPQRIRPGRILASIAGAAEPATLPVTTPSALRIGRTVRVALTAGAPVTQLSVRLRRHGVTIAGARVARADGPTVVRLRPLRRLRPGIHQLELRGIDQTGAVATRTVVVRLRAAR